MREVKIPEKNRFKEKAFEFFSEFDGVNAYASFQTS
jgi:hypothetical protein